MRSVAALLIAAALAALTGCSAPAEPAPAPTQSPSATPVFASDEEALAAAEKAYSEYLNRVDAALNDGARDLSGLDEVASGAALEADLADGAEFEAEGLRTVGVRTVANALLQSFDDSQVRLYVCEDVSSVDLLDASGRSLVSTDRPARQAFEVAVNSATRHVDERVARRNEGVCP